MSDVEIFKLGFMIAVCLLSLTAASCYAFSLAVALEPQKMSVRFFMKFFLSFSLAFVLFAVASFHSNFVTIIVSGLVYILSFKYLKLGFVTRKPHPRSVYQKIDQEFYFLSGLTVFLNGYLFLEVWNNQMIRILTIIAIACYYTMSSIRTLQFNNLSKGELASKYSLYLIVLFMLGVMSVLIFTGDFSLYLTASLISQCVSIILVLSSTQVMIFNDATQRYKREATTDFLTGLYNRRYLQNRIKEIIYSSKRELTPVSLMLIDIDHFKSINDTYGHDAGDKALIKISEVIKQSSHLSDISARYGGEEFCILLPNTSTEGAHLLASRMKDTIEQLEVKFDEQTITLTASFGIADVDVDESPNTALQNADNALYQSKNNGRNQVTVFNQATSSNGASSAQLH